MNQKAHGFTIVELLIVVVVIAILAALSYVGYTSMQARARDSQRQSDIAAITKALELYYIDNGSYPPGSWAYSDEASWNNLLTALRPYASGLSTGDPINTRNGSGAQAAHIYAYFTNTTGSVGTPGYCGVTGVRQMFIITYRLEVSEKKEVKAGECDYNPLQYVNSWYRSAKH